MSEITVLKNRRNFKIKAESKQLNNEKTADYYFADLIVRSSPEYNLSKERMSKYLINDYIPEMSSVPSLLIKYLPPNLYNSYVEESKKSACSAEQFEYIMLGRQFARKLISQNGLVLHSSAVVLNGKAYLFSAPCGTGKSTHTALWEKIFEGAVIINDDKPAIRIIDGKVYVYGTPFSGKTDKNLNRKAEMGAICFLERGSENLIWEIKPDEAIKLLISQTILPRDKELIDRLFALLNQLLSIVPIYRMKCTISDEAAIMAFEKMGGKHFEN